MIQYNLTNATTGDFYTAGNTTDTIHITTNPVYYTPPAALPPIPEDIAEEDLDWLYRRVEEIEEFSRLAA